MGRTILKDFNLGGIADSILQGPANSLYKIKGVDLHSKPGVLRLSQKLVKESGATVDDRCRMVVCSNGETYLFGAGNNAGKIWRRKSNGTYELAYTTAPAAGDKDCVGACEYNGYILWATQSRLHRISTTNALVTSWATLDLNWQTLTAASYHPMLEVNLDLYIGNGSAVALVDDTFTFTASKLAINTPHIVSALGKTPDGYQLLIGTIISTTVNRCKVYRWNTWSQNFSADDDIYEAGVNCFLPFDNLAVLNAGQKGNLYYFSSDAWVKYRRIPGDWTTTNKAYIRDGSFVNAGGSVLFGLSNVSGNPAEQGVYELGAYDPNYPSVFSIKHIISSTNTTGVQMGDLALIGDQLLASWTDTGVGVDLESTSAKTLIGAIETRVLTAERDLQKEVNIKIAFRSLPTGAGISPYYDKGAGYASLDFQYDTDRLLAEGTVRVGEAPFVNFKIELVAGTGGNVNNTPEIEQIIIDF